jgi:O-antigen/teichoic acid export membrane protein
MATGARTTPRRRARVSRPSLIASWVAPRWHRWSEPIHRATFGSLATGVLSQAVLIVSGVLVARLLGPQNRGYLALLTLLPVVLSQLGGAGVPAATTYFVARSAGRARSLLRSLRKLAIAQALAMLCAHAVMLWLFFGDGPGFVLVAGALTLIQAPLFLGYDYALAVLQGKQRFGPFNVLRVLPTAAYSLALVALFIIGEATLTAVVITWVVTYAGCAAVLAVRTRRELAGETEETPEGTRREVLRFGLKGFLGSVSPLETFRLDQAIVGLFLSPTALGLYVVGLAFTNLPRFLAQSIGVVAYPNIAGRSDPASAKRAIWRFFWLTAALCTLTVLALELAVGTLLPFFFGDAFADATPIARILLVAGLFLSLRRILSDVARGAGRAGLGTVGEISSWVFLLPSLAVLAARHEVEGVAVALVISSALSLLVAMIAFVRFPASLDRPLPEGRPLAP